MQLRYRSVLSLVAVCLALAAAPAFAAKTSPTMVPLPEGSFLPPVGEINGPASACQLGPTAAAGFATWFFPADDYYYSFFDPAACGCPGGITNFVAHWSLLWSTPCTINVRAWIVPAVQTAPGCYVPGGPISPPDPATSLCGPTALITLDGGAAGGLINHAIPLPQCACLDNGEKAFVLIEIVSSSPNCVLDQGALTSPAIVYGPSPALTCTSYNAYPGSGGPVDIVPVFGFPGNMTMWVEPDCCGVTPTLPGSWGMLKTLYR